MAAAANKSTGDASAAVNSPSRRSPPPSPWTQVVRGPPDSELITTSADLFDSTAETGGADSNAAKKSAWNKPSNGAADVGPVMGADLWPALSESTRASPKASLLDSPKQLHDGSVTLPLAAGIGPSSSINQAVINNAHPSLPPPNHVIPTRQVSMKRGGVSSSGNNIGNGGFSQPSSVPNSPAADTQPNMLGKSVPAVTELSPRDHTLKEGGQRVVGSQSRSGTDHIQKSDSFKKGNGSYHHNYGGKGNQDREWNSQRSFNGRDSQRASPRGGYRPSTHVPTPFVNPPPVAIRPYPMVYSDVPPQMFLYAAPQEPFRGVPLVAPVSPHGMYYTGPDPQLIVRIVHQIDYYFSNENLVKDIYLRNNMDDQGWVPVRLIAGFKKMSILTENIQLILDAVRGSSMVEVQGDKVRRRGDWARWIMPTVQSPNVSSPHAQGSSNQEMLIINAQSLSLEEKPSFSRSSSEDFSRSQASGQAAVGPRSNQTVSVRSPSE